jgi:hypothetical protein
MIETPAPAATLFPQVAVVDSLEACSCTSALYACSSFSSWAVAQACYTYCQVEAGYDIHNLDPDRNGVACELELQDVAPLDATPNPQLTPLPSSGVITPANSLEPSRSLDPGLAVTGIVTNVITTGVTTATTTVVTNTTNTIVTNTQLPDQQVAVSPVQSANVTTTMTAAADDPAQTAATSTESTPENSTPNTLELLTLLLFSPLGIIALIILVVGGALGLWLAYLLGQSARSQPEQMTTKPMPEEFVLQPHIDRPASET